MARRPKLCLHKSSNQAFVRLNGKHGPITYLGKYGSPESQAEYDRLIGVWESRQSGTFPISVLGMSAAFMQHAEEYYRSNGEPTGEHENFRSALRTLSRMFGHSPAADFGPKKLKAVRQRMIEDGIARSTINGRVRRIRQVFKWAVSEERIPATVLIALQSVHGLSEGRSAAKETSPVEPVPELSILAVKPHVSRPVWALIQFMLLTGARPGEAVRLRWCDIDAESDVWIYRPEKHKTKHRGKRRIVPIGPRAQRVLNEFPASDSAYVFQPQMGLDEFAEGHYRDGATDAANRRAVANRLH